MLRPIFRVGFLIFFTLGVLINVSGCGSSGGGNDDGDQGTILTRDTTPNPFSFVDQSDVPIQNEIISNTITVSGINVAASIVISGTGAAYSINGGIYTDDDGTVANGDVVSVMLVSSSSYNATTSAILSIGGVSNSFNVTTQSNGTSSDTTPDPFSFDDLYDVARNTIITSNTITVTGINSAASIIISGTGASYSVNGGIYTGASGTVKNGDTIAVRLTSSSSYNTTVAAILTVGGVSVTFNVTTGFEGGARDVTPDSFSFISQTDVATLTAITSNQITVRGIDTPTSISISGGIGYSINEGLYTRSPGTVAPGDTVSVRVTSASSNNMSASAIVTIGNVSASFNVITELGSAAMDYTPEAFSFVSQSGVARSSLITSNPITVSGINQPTGISITDTEGENSTHLTYSINGNAFTSTTGIVLAGDVVRLRVVSSSDYNAAVSAVLTICDVSGIFNVTTETGGDVADTTPNSFTFTPKVDVFRDAIITSNEVTVSGINAATAVSITGNDGKYSINGGEYTDATRILTNGDTLRIQMSSSTSPETTVSTSITVGTLTCIFTATTCSEAMTTDGTLRVRVLGDNDQVRPDATVVLGAPNGEMVNYGITDENGEVMFSYPPVNATVTAAFAYIPEWQTEYSYSLNAYYDVNVSEITLSVEDGTNSYDYTGLGNGTLTITNSVGAEYWHLYGVEDDSGYPYNSYVKNFTVYEEHIQNDGNFSVVVIGYDADYNPVGYGVLLDHAVSDDMDLGISIDHTDFESVTFDFSNVPDTAYSISYGISPVRKAESIGGFSDSYQVPIPATVDANYIPGVGDSWFYSLRLYYNEGDYDNGIVFFKKSDNLGNLLIDFNQLLSMPSDPFMDAVGTESPNISWGGGANTSYVSIYMYYFSNGHEYDYGLYCPPTRNSVVFPQLPDSIREFRPLAADSVNVRFVKSSIFSSYNEHLEIMEDYYEGTFTAPEFYEITQAEATYDYINGD